MPTSSPVLIHVDHISLNISGQCVLEDISFSLHEREILTLIGPNGAGKSSLARIILGIQKPTSGQVIIHRPISFGYMPQKLLIDQALPLTVLRFLCLADPRLTTTEARQALEEVKAESIGDKPVQSLSGGELQRALLARTLLRNPNVLVLDEPMQGVDAKGQVELYQLLTEIRRQRQCAIVLVSHDLHLVMAATDTVVCINKHVCCSGHPHTVQNSPQYRALFTREELGKIAIYGHHHNHEHTLDGEVYQEKP